MNQITVGPGDSATWGPVTRRQDPRYTEFRGLVSFEMPIGLDSATVIVTGDACDDELAEINEVLFCGVDIRPALELQGLANIAAYYERHSEAIQRQAIRDAKEAAL